MDAMKRTGVGRTYQAPALEKGLDALELFASESRGLSKTDVARRLGRTVSEVFRMLMCLESRGYIARSGESERYSLTLHLFKLAYQHPPIERLITEALPIMRDVAYQLKQSCHLGVLEGDRVVVIAHVNAPHNSGFSVKTGGIGDLMRSTTGHVILAHQAPEVSSRAIKLWSKHNRTRPSVGLDEHLNKIKQRGFDERKSYEVEGVINISFPILDDRGYAVAALSVPFLQRVGESTTTATAKRVLGAASSNLSQAIGGVGNPTLSRSKDNLSPFRQLRARHE
jgi:DNA-binding IclR family transcriptional regulator